MIDFKSGASMTPTLIILCLASVADFSCPGVLSAHDTVLIEGTFCLQNDSDEVGSFRFPITGFNGAPIIFASPNLHFCGTKAPDDFGRYPPFGPTGKPCTSPCELVRN
jgi:hypothetical protein